MLGVSRWEQPTQWSQAGKESHLMVKNTAMGEMQMEI